MGKQQKYMSYPMFRISSFGKDHGYGKQRKTGESFGIYHAVGGVRHRLRKCVEIPVDVRAERWRKLHADLRDLPDRAGPAHHDHGILRGACGADESTLYVSEIIRRQGQMESVGHRLSHRKHCAIAFYAVVSGWILYYFVKFLTGQNQDFGFEKMITTPSVNVTYLLFTLLIAFVILSFHLQGGLERITKYMMSALIVLMLVLAVHSFTLPGAGEGLSFYLIPHFSKITGSVVVGAMNQAFFTLSVGMGGMAIFGSYVGKDRSLMGESIHIIILDTLVAVIAGIIIFPACFTYDVEVTAGPSLLFDTMATVFNNMAGGRWWGTLFFLFMVFAAMSTVLGVCENILAMVRELTGWSRPVGCIVCGVGTFLLALTTALGFSVIHFQPFAAGTTWLDFWDFLVSNNIMPIGSILLAVFCCYKVGWGWDKFLEEANEGKGLKVQHWMKPVFKYFVPAAVLFIYVYGIVNFAWK